MGIGYETYDQLDGKIDAWGCSVGSGATLLGVILALKEKGVTPFTFGVVPYGSESYIKLDKPTRRKASSKCPRSNSQLVDWMGLNKWQTEKSINEEMLGMGYPEEFF